MLQVLMHSGFRQIKWNKKDMVKYLPYDHEVVSSKPTRMLGSAAMSNLLPIKLEWCNEAISTPGGVTVPGC